MTEHVLDLLDRRDIRGTFFIVGEIAKSCPGLVRRIAERGHEIGSHGHRHVALIAEQPEDFAARIGDARRRLEDIGGRAVLGFRAPMLSLTPATSWAVGAIREAGYAYSSSVLPAPNFLYGFPAAPRRPFLWPNGLLEIPCPVAKLGPIALPFTGGMYLRYLPPWRLRWMMRRASPWGLWTYCHPYDFDLDEPFGRAEGRGVVASFFLWRNRRRTARRLATLIEGHSAQPFAARLDELKSDAVFFAPTTPRMRGQAVPIEFAPAASFEGSD